MSHKIYQVNKEFRDIVPQEVLDLEDKATWHDPKRGVSDMTTKKELLEEHSLCAGCPEAMAIRYILASLPKPEDTIIVNSTGCTSLVFPHISLHTIHSLFGNQNAVASGLKRVLDKRFKDNKKDVVVLAGDGATADIGFDCTMHSFFRQENITTICFDNEVYANTGGQASGMTPKGAVFKMSPKGKEFKKIPMYDLAIQAGCHYVAMLTVSNPRRVAKVIKEAVVVAREVGPTYVHLYTPCILEIGLSANDALMEMKSKDKERFSFQKYQTPEAEALIADHKKKGLL